MVVQKHAIAYIGNVYSLAEQHPLEPTCISNVLLPSVHQSKQAYAFFRLLLKHICKREFCSQEPFQPGHQFCRCSVRMLIFMYVVKQLLVMEVSFCRWRGGDFPTYCSATFLLSEGIHITRRITECSGLEGTCAGLDGSSVNGGCNCWCLIHLRWRVYHVSDGESDLGKVLLCK